MQVAQKRPQRAHQISGSRHAALGALARQERAYVRRAQPLQAQPIRALPARQEPQRGRFIRIEHRVIFQPALDPQMAAVIRQQLLKRSPRADRRRHRGDPQRAQVSQRQQRAAGGGPRHQTRRPPRRGEPLGLLVGQLAEGESFALKPTAELIELIQPIRCRRRRIPLRLQPRPQPRRVRRQRPRHRRNPYLPAHRYLRSDRTNTNPGSIDEAATLC